MTLSKGEQNALMNQKSAWERRRAHLRLQISRAGNNASSKLYGELENVELKIMDLDAVLSGAKVFQAKKEVKTGRSAKDWVLVVVGFLGALALLAIAILLDWISGVQGVILAIIPLLVTWITRRIMDVKNGESGKRGSK